MNLLLYVTTVLIWGSTWYAIDFQLGVVDPGVSLTYRFLLAALLAFGWCAVRRLPLRFDFATHRHFMLLGACLFGLNYLSAYQAQFYISSALNAIGFSSLICMNIVNAWLLFGRRVGWRTLTGAALGITGILIVFLPEVRSVSLEDRLLIGMFFSLLGTLFASFGNLASQVIQDRRIPVVQTNAWGMFYGAVLNGCLAALLGKEFNFDPSPGYVLSLLYLSIMGSAIAFACYLVLLGRIGIERAGYAAVMIPIVALGFSAVLEGMAIGANVIAGLALAVAGNIFILVRSARRGA